MGQHLFCWALPSSVVYNSRNQSHLTLVNHPLNKQMRKMQIHNRVLDQVLVSFLKDKKKKLSTKLTLGCVFCVYPPLGFVVWGFSYINKIFANYYRLLFYALINSNKLIQCIRLSFTIIGKKLEDFKERNTNNYQDKDI